MSDNKERFLLVNSIQTPDGTILVSRHRHDFICHEDSVTGTRYCIDGGSEYIRWSTGGDYKNLCVYSDDPHEMIRAGVERGGRGIDGDEPLTFVTLDKMNNAWLDATIVYEEKLRPNNRYIPIYKAEVEYRKQNKINII